MVVGGLSEAEGAALGMHQYGKGYLETATLFGGVDRAGPQGRLMQFLGLTTGAGLCLCSGLCMAARLRSCCVRPLQGNE